MTWVISVSDVIFTSELRESSTTSLPRPKFCLRPDAAYEVITKFQRLTVTLLHTGVHVHVSNPNPERLGGGHARDHVENGREVRGARGHVFHILSSVRHIGK